MIGPEVVSQPLGGSPLALAAQAGQAPNDWYEPRPVSADAWRARAKTIAAEFDGSRWLEALAPAFAASGRAAARLARVASSGGVVVTTGQQPGLFGGPVYTWSKALTALALADEIEGRALVAAAPVFWAATDDADFAEARWTKVVIDGQVVRLEMSGEHAPGTPMSATPLGEVAAELRELRAAAGSAAYEDALAVAQGVYGAGGTVGGAYIGLLRAILEPLGVAVIDASHPAVRLAGAAVLREALARAVRVASALGERTADLRGAGFEPQVVDAETLSLVFAMSGGTKRRIAVAEAPNAVVDRPETLAPNVLLRPVLERAILPTVAYAAGPAELAYFAQATAVADALDAARPLAVPRWSGTIIEPHVARILDRLGVSYADLRHPHAVEGVLAGAGVPADVALTLARIREVVVSSAEALASGAPEPPLIPSAAVEGARNSILERLHRLERRYLAAVKRRDEVLMRRVATARAHLYPDGQQQERSLNLLPMLARQGPRLLEAMTDAARVHARATVGSGGPPPRAARAASAASQQERHA